MSDFYPGDAAIPTSVQTDEYLLWMLRATDVERDYEAVIASREDLLIRTSGRWPRDGFTLAENLNDLEQHEREHHARIAFTYTVMDPSESRCLGCAYINPLRVMLTRFPPRDAGQVIPSDMIPYVTFWVRPDYPGPELDRRLFATLRGWFSAKWAFPQILFMANGQQTRHLSLYEEVGLVRLFFLEQTEPPVTYHFFG